MSTFFGLIAFAAFVCAFLGLIKPNLFTRLSKKPMTRLRSFGIFSGIFIISLIFAATTSPSQPTTENQKDTDVTQTDTTAGSSTVSGNEKENLAPFVEQTNTQPAPTPVKKEAAPVKTQAPTPVPTKTENEPTSSSSETVSQKNAVQKAKSYLNYAAFSHDGLVAQLEYDQFSHIDAVYGADNSGANWNEQATKKAKSYMEYSAFSRGSLIAQLEYDKFTQAQAEYGADAVGL